MRITPAVSCARVDHLKGHAVLNGSSELDFAEDKRCLKTENRLSGPGFQRQVGRDRQFPDKNATHEVLEYMKIR